RADVEADDDGLRRCRQVDVRPAPVEEAPAPAAPPAEAPAPAPAEAVATPAADPAATPAW
ncbi:hypothetical protein OJ997_15620, partial [Solirubrobacter phytolaccae]